LTERDGCLVLQIAEQDYLLLWPDRYSLDQRALAVSSGSVVVATVGDLVTVGGGERTRLQADAILADPLPSRCQDVESIWMVTAVLKGS
jgi:hypothetical protein